MSRDVQILLLFLAVVAGIGIYVLENGVGWLQRTDRPIATVSEPSSPAPLPAPTPSAEMPVAATPGGQCVEIRLFDANGVVIPVDPPFVGIMIGDGPLFEGAPPPFAKSEPGRFVPCPAQLLASTRKTFEDFCTTEERRKKAAAANSADISLINKRCADLTAALSK